MTWYNTKIDNYNYKFFDDKNDRIVSAEECYKTLDRLNYKNEIDHNKSLKNLESLLDQSWELIVQLQNKYPKHFKDAKHNSHLKGLNRKTNRPSYTACIYLCTNHRNIAENNLKVVNLSILANDVNLEIRYPLAEFFSCGKFEENYPACKLGYINGLPQISLKKFLKISNIDELINVIGDYVTSLHKFLDEGGKLRTFGESKSEVLLFQDLEHLYSKFRSSDQWLLHGQRPIQRKNGNWLELDLQMKIKLDGIFRNIAIEIQGPHHYINQLGNNNNWGNIAAKHNEKLQWCLENGYLFVWIDWEYFQKIFVMNGQQPRLLEDRRRRIKFWMNNILSQSNAIQNAILIEGFPNIPLKKEGVPDVKWWNSLDDLNILDGE